MDSLQISLVITAAFFPWACPQEAFPWLTCQCPREIAYPGDACFWREFKLLPRRVGFAAAAAEIAAFRVFALASCVFESLHTNFAIQRYFLSDEVSIIAVQHRCSFYLEINPAIITLHMIIFNRFRVLFCVYFDRI